MIKTLSKKKINGSLRAIPSKSMAHRLFICAALAERPTEIECHGWSDDIAATVRCLEALGAHFDRNGDILRVTPVTPGFRFANCDCGESGTTLRLLLPVICAAGCGCTITMHGRLPERPISPLREELIAHGCDISAPGINPMSVSGKLRPGTYTIPGNISSQFISGLLFALPLTGQDCEIQITGKIESISYIRMTLAALAQFGIQSEHSDHLIRIPGGQTYCSVGSCTVEADWSNAAFPLCAAALGGSLTLTGIGNSLQGDRAILEILQRFGAQVNVSHNRVTVEKAKLHSITIDAADIPDLVPVIAVTAAGAYGKTVITNAGRLRIKESDRLETVCEMLTNLGADIQQTPDGLIINGTGSLSGGTVHAHNDHRIAMSAAVASVISDHPVIIEDAQSVNKSYPGFFEDFNKI